MSDHIRPLLALVLNGRQTVILLQRGCVLRAIGHDQKSNGLQSGIKCRGHLAALKAQIARSSANRVQSRSHLKSKVENSDDRMAQEMGTGADCVGFAVLKSGERSVGQSFHRQTQRTVEGTLRLIRIVRSLVVPLLPIRTN
jgi:hypothetical protein